MSSLPINNFSVPSEAVEDLLCDISRLRFSQTLLSPSPHSRMIVSSSSWTESISKRRKTRWAGGGVETRHGGLEVTLDTKGTILQPSQQRLHTAATSGQLFLPLGDCQLDDVVMSLLPPNLSSYMREARRMKTTRRHNRRDCERVDDFFCWSYRYRCCCSGWRRRCKDLKKEGKRIAVTMSGVSVERKRCGQKKERSPLPRPGEQRRRRSRGRCWFLKRHCRERTQNLQIPSHRHRLRQLFQSDGCSRACRPSPKGRLRPHCILLPLQPDTTPPEPPPDR